MATSQYDNPRTHEIRIGDILLFPGLDDRGLRLRNVAVVSSASDGATLELELVRTESQVSE